MDLTVLKLPAGKSSFDLDERVNQLFREIGAVLVKDETIGNVYREELHEISQQGAIEYLHGFGNEIPVNVNAPGANRQMQASGHLLLIGFDEATEYFSGLKATIHSKLAGYIISLNQS